MDSDESRDNSNSPESLVQHVRSHGDTVVHVLYAAPMHMPSSHHPSGQCNGSDSLPLKHSPHNGSDSLHVDCDDEAYGAIVNCNNPNRTYHAAYSANGFSPKNASSSLYNASEHSSGVKYIGNCSHQSKLQHQMNRSVNSGHAIAGQQSANVSSNSPHCVLMIQQNGGSELMPHAHSNNGLPTSVVLATGLPLPISPVTSGVQGSSNTPVTSAINLPSLHQYALASSKRKSSQFAFMPIDPAILSSNHHQPSSHPQHALSMHNSPQSQSKSSPGLQLLSSSSEFASSIGNNSCSGVTSSVIRGAIGQSTSSHPLSLSPSMAPSAAVGQVGMKNRDEKRRATHNEVERRRRDKINSWILKLSKLVPDCNSDQTKQGQSKGGILAKTCDFIASLEGRLSAIERENQDLKNARLMLMDKINELEREKHKLLSQLSSSTRDSSPASGNSSSRVAPAKILSTSDHPSIVPADTLFPNISSANQIKQERLAACLSNNPQSAPDNSSNTNHIHSSVDVSNGSAIDQTSVIVTVTSSASSMSPTVHNCIAREQSNCSVIARDAVSSARCADNRKMICDESESSLVTQAQEDENITARSHFIGNSHNAPADSNNKGLINLKISSSHHLSDKSCSTPTDAVVTVHDNFTSSSSKCHAFTDEHVNF